jgi:hypothetical protein
MGFCYLIFEKRCAWISADCYRNIWIYSEFIIQRNLEASLHIIRMGPMWREEQQIFSARIRGSKTKELPV